MTEANADFSIHDSKYTDALRTRIQNFEHSERYTNMYVLPVLLT
jgi:hypothetical protein